MKKPKTAGKVRIKPIFGPPPPPPLRLIKNPPLPKVAIIVPLLSFGTMSAIKAFVAGVKMEFTTCTETIKSKVKEKSLEKGKRNIGKEENASNKTTILLLLYLSIRNPKGIDINIPTTFATSRTLPQAILLSPIISVT
jgi:hypothetical protein